MDELTLFKGADPKLIHLEKRLLSQSDIVFTGGKSLYESKKEVHHNVHCFPSSVDRAHFEQALNGVPVPEDIQLLDKPVIGYCGVVDERLNLELLEQVANMNPEASFVLVGPLAKISEADLPQCDNIHYLGMRPYQLLPNYMKGFDIAMMPFALNDATKYISPTKTLEYMAAGKPIISTPIYDVIRDYKNHISIVDTAEEFSAAIRDIMKTKKLKDPFRTRFNDILDATSWDKTVAGMESLLTVNAERNEAV
jgi:glycosyltransferase involved in cell wall biosynthesis